MTFTKRLLGAVLVLGAIAASACGGAAKQTNTNTNTGANTQQGGGEPESQPSK